MLAAVQGGTWPTAAQHEGVEDEQQAHGDGLKTALTQVPAQCLAPMIFLWGLQDSACIELPPEAGFTHVHLTACLARPASHIGAGTTAPEGTQGINDLVEACVTHRSLGRRPPLTLTR